MIFSRYKKNRLIVFLKKNYSFNLSNTIYAGHFNFKIFTLAKINEHFIIFSNFKNCVSQKKKKKNYPFNLSNIIFKGCFYFVPIKLF